MANSINSSNINGLQDNPFMGSIGTPEGNAIILDSGYSSGVVRYEIRRKDQQGPVIRVRSTDSTSELVLSVSATRLKIVLQPRTLYQFRVSQNGGAFTSWVDFKTRAKAFRSPDLVNQQLTTVRNTRRGATVTVVNTSKARVITSGKQVIVRNSDTQFADISSTSRDGKRITTKTRIRNVGNGAQLDTRLTPTGSTSAAVVRVYFVGGASPESCFWEFNVPFSTPVTVEVEVANFEIFNDGNFLSPVSVTVVNSTTLEIEYEPNEAITPGDAWRISGTSALLFQNGTTLEANSTGTIASG